MMWLWLMCAALVAVFSFVLLWPKRAPRLNALPLGAVSRQLRRAAFRREAWEALRRHDNTADVEVRNGVVMFFDRRTRRMIARFCY